ncbi:MAG: integration host factor subunit beta [Candidatus Kapabacteria bacterium]|nr:integration host factor subunit beta [Candidatus Kapabacteria bacterium]
MSTVEKKSDNVTKAELVEAVAEQTGLTKLEVKAVVEGFLNGIKDAMAERRRIELRGFGVFSVKSRKARIARNPRTGQTVELEGRFAPVFKASGDFIMEVDDHIKNKTVV